MSVSVRSIARMLCVPDDDDEEGDEEGDVPMDSDGEPVEDDSDAEGM